MLGTQFKLSPLTKERLADMCSLGQWNITFPLLFHETVKPKLRPVVTERG